MTSSTPTQPALVERFFGEVLSPAGRDDPYPAYAAFREESTLAEADANVWLALGHADVGVALRHPLLSSNERRSTSFARQVAADPALAAEPQAPSLLFMDPPDHTRLRGLVARAFTPRVVDELRFRTRAIAAGLLDALARAGAGGTPIDVITGLAYPLPVRVICALLGVPEADEERFTGWSRQLARSVDPAALLTPDIIADIVAADAALDQYFEALLVERAALPGADLISSLLAVEAEGDRITHVELVELATLLLVAGHETTVNLIGNGTAALLAHPDQQALLRAQPGLLDAAVDELLRYDSPVQMNQRVVTEDLVIGGQALAAGDQLILVLGAANRDPAAFPEPDRLDVTRDARRHVGFGGGIHHCLGAALARMEAQVAIGALLKRFPHLEPAGASERRPTFTLRGLEHLPVVVS